MNPDSAAVLPPHVPPGLVVDLDLDRVGDDPLAVFDDVRASGRRVVWIPPCAGATDGGWLLLKAADIRTALQSPGLFSSVPAVADGTSHQISSMKPIFADPPAVQEYRRLLLPLFSPVAVKQFSATLRQSAQELIAAFSRTGQCNFVEQFARPYSTRLFVTMFGLPVEETEHFVALGHRIMHPRNPEDLADVLAEVMSILNGVVQARISSPRDDLISHVVHGQVNGQPLPEDDARGIALLLYTAGLDTVTAALTFSFRYLGSHPAARQRLAAHPDLIRTAVDELLRRHSFVNNSRRVTRELEFAGVRMMPGDRVICSQLLGSRDPAEFPDPDIVDFDRKGNRHFAFGAGPHRCVGSYLARQEMTIALEEWHQVIPEYRYLPSDQPRGIGGIVMGLTEIELAWDTVPARPRAARLAPVGTERAQDRANGPFTKVGD